MATINILDISNKALELRKRLGEDSFSPIDILSLVQQISNITLIMYPMGSNISGYCHKSKHSIIIVINSSMTEGRQRYSLAHELYHVYYDDSMSSYVCSNFNNKSENEKKADLFASYFLMPQTALSDYSKPVNLDAVVKLEQFYRLSRKAVLFRLYNEKLITDKELEDYSKDVKASAKWLGYDDSLYNSSPEDKQYFVYGKYIVDVKSLLQDNKISIGKYEEYLISAYRDDLVYGIEDGGDFVD